jgi:hypothetical protein
LYHGRGKRRLSLLVRKLLVLVPCGRASTFVPTAEYDRSRQARFNGEHDKKFPICATPFSIPDDGSALSEKVIESMRGKYLGISSLRNYKEFGIPIALKFDILCGRYSGLKETKA